MSRRACRAPRATVSQSRRRVAVRAPNRARIRCCVSGHVSAVPKGGDGVEEPVPWTATKTWLTRPFAAAIGAPDRRRQFGRASASTKPSSSESGSARLTYPYRSGGVAVEVIRAENDFERAGPRPTRCGRRFGAAAAGIALPPPTSGLSESRVFTRRENACHRRGTNSLLAAADAALGSLRY